MTAPSPTTPEQLVKRSIAVEQMYATVADLGLDTRIGLDLRMRHLTRDQYDMFDGREDVYPTTLAEGGILYAKTVLLWDEQIIDGQVWPDVQMTLFTHEPPTGGA